MTDWPISSVIQYLRIKSLGVIRLVQNVYKDQYVKFGLFHVFLTLALKCEVDF